MPFYETVKSLICTPTDKCCKILCSKCKAEPDSSHTSDKTGKVKPSSRKNKPNEVRRHTGWNPKELKISDDDEDDDDGESYPAKIKWTNKDPMVYPLTIASTGSDVKQTDDYVVKRRWTNKDAEIFSAITMSDAKSSRYWIQSNLQYVIMLPVQKYHRPPPPAPTPSAPPPSPTTSVVEEEEPPESHQLESVDRIKPNAVDSSEDDESDVSFEPRSNAKPAAPKTKKFCCAKRQDSG